MKAFVFVLALTLASAAAHPQPLADPALEAKAQVINNRVMALDTHVDFPEDCATATMDPARKAS